MISIGTNNNAKDNDAPGGKNNPKKCKPCFLKPIIFRPIKLTIPKVKVKIRWLVTVNVYGIIPIKLQLKTKKNMTKIKGKNLFEFELNAEKATSWTNSYKLSITHCK